MGTSYWAGADERARVFASAFSWIEGAATKQLRDLLDRNGVVGVAGMPDLHPGHRGPVGCAVLAEGRVHPSIVGTDIGCGMALRLLEGHERKLKLDKAERALEGLGEDWRDEALAAASEYGLVVDDGFAGSLGTIGGGNHFLELQAVHEVVDVEGCAAANIGKGSLALLAHTGSRSLGAAVYARHQAGPDGLPIGDDGGYMADHDTALRYAELNRRLVLDRAAALLRMEGEHLLDVPHNHVEIRGTAALHRKGAAPSDRGLVPVPGSRGAMTYLVRPRAGVEGALDSIAHGAGRKRDRASMVARSKGRDGSPRPNPVGNRVICADRRLAAEEGPDAYKDIRQVVADLEAFGMADVVAVLRPVVTFKTTEA